MNDLVITSLEIADCFGKRHTNVLRDIEKTKASYERLGTGDAFFKKSYYKDIKGEQRPMYYVNDSVFSFLAMNFRGKQAFKWRVALVKTYCMMEAVYKQMYEKEVDGENLLVADSLEEAFLAWGWGDTPLMDWLKEPRSERPKKCVYAMEMSNGTVKIGVAQDFEKRANTISHSSGLYIRQKYHTDYMDADKAFALEHKCHQAFHNQRTGGEYFAIPFDAAKEAIIEACLT